MRRGLEFNFFIKSAFFAFFLYLLGNFYYTSSYDKLSSYKTIPIIDVERIEKGYTLLSPYNRVLTEKSESLSQIYLVDLFGKPVHTWITRKQTLYSQLKRDGGLLTISEMPEYTNLFPPGGNTGVLQELDWKSNIVWEYRNEALHHDIAQLPNGNIAATLWEETPIEVASKIQGGAAGSLLPTGVVWSDKIIEIDINGKVVWSWHSYKHLNPEIDVLGPLMPKYAWTFINGLSYIKNNPIDNTPAYLASMRSINTVMIIRKSDGEIIWRSPKGMLHAQHDPTLLSNGNILVFDNGLDKNPDPFPSYGSRVVEINPKTNKVEWQFEGGKGVIDKVRFYAPIVSGAQRLQNGNTLITDGPKGHIFEVTENGEVVWDFISPYTTIQTGSFPNNFLFKARRYTENDVEFPSRIKNPVDPVKYGLYQFLNGIYFSK